MKLDRNRKLMVALLVFLNLSIISIYFLVGLHLLFFILLITTILGARMLFSDERPRLGMALLILPISLILLTIALSSIRGLLNGTL